MVGLIIIISITKRVTVHVNEAGHKSPFSKVDYGNTRWNTFLLADGNNPFTFNNDGYVGKGFASAIDQCLAQDGGLLAESCCDNAVEKQ